MNSTFVYYFNLFAIFVHFCLAWMSVIIVYVSGIREDVKFETTGTRFDVVDRSKTNQMFDGVQFGGGPKMYPVLFKFDGTGIRVTLIVYFFCLLSACGQSYFGWYKAEYISLMEKGFYVNYFRYIEYSFSASIMIVLISLEVGIVDFGALIGFCGCTWSCMMFGLFADYFFLFDNLENEKLDRGLTGLSPRADISVSFEKLWKSGDSARKSGDSVLSELFSFHTISLRQCGWISHFCGWCVMSIPFYVIFISLFRGDDTPKFVYWIVFVECVLFIFFGLTQLYHLLNYEKRRCAMIVEFAYILQSLLSKVVLFVFVFSVVLA